MRCQHLSSIHTDSIICLNVIKNESASAVLLSGGEDGILSFTSLSDHKYIDKITVPTNEACTAISSNCKDFRSIAASFGQSILHLDLRKSFNQDSIVDIFTVNNDEINSISMDSTGKWVAASDDTGEVQVIALQSNGPHDIKTSSTTAKKQYQYKTLRRGHTNIASAVAFRRSSASSTDQLLSGGLDCRIISWDFMRLKQLHSWNIQEESISHQESGKICNPPMVHHIATPSGSHSDSLVNRIFAVARGDGYISLYDSDHRAQTSSMVSSTMHHGSSKRKSTRTHSSMLYSRKDSVAFWYSAPSDQGGHSGAVNGVSFLPKDERCLVSVGNDAQVCAWRWLDNDSSPLVASMKHSAKINCVSGTSSLQCDAIIGDVNGRLSCVFLDK